MQYPLFTPMRLASLRDPFDHEDWLFELKYDGFRALALCDGSAVRLVSRNRNVYKSFAPLATEIAAALRDRRAVLDGEIVCLDGDGKPQFYDLLRRRADAWYYAFDLLHLDGRDLRDLPLIDPKAMLKGLVPSGSRPLYTGHVDGRGVDLYRAVCANDLEGIVAKWKHGTYVAGEQQPADRVLARHARNPEAAARLTWLKIRNPAYTQMDGRGELFEKRGGMAAGAG